MRKRVFGHMRTVKAQISLRIRADWSGPSLSANKIIRYYKMYECRRKARMILCACARGSGPANVAHVRWALFRLTRSTSCLIEIICLFWCCTFFSNNYPTIKLMTKTSSDLCRSCRHGCSTKTMRLSVKTVGPTVYKHKKKYFEYIEDLAWEVISYAIYETRHMKWPRM